MWSTTHQLGNLILLMMLALFINATYSRKLDETLVPQSPNLGIKCSTCSCANPCDQQLLSPPPPPPPPPPKCPYCTPLAAAAPPPPRFIYFTEPLAPPPPSSRFTYFTGPPGNLYRTDPYDLAIYSSAKWNVVSLPVLVGFGLLQLVLAFW